MDSHAKVMTVSYGTFACTLDGFDDPFTTMQLVAEYFRKLSADDRYFGSEPLQPDASKLHQIAISANPNRIDAEVSDNSVILRQADVVDASSEVQPVDTDAPAPEDVMPLEETAPQNDVVSETQTAPVEETVDVTYENTASFSSRRTIATAETSALDTAVTEEDITPVVTPEEETVADTISDTLISSLDENINDTTTADELSPSLEDEIPSETVSAAVKALKSGEAVDRWLETANEKMAMPEHVSKANALERLKAAVAATEAERATRMDKITPDMVIETGEERRDNTISFRRELAKVRKAYELETSVFSRPKAHNVTTNGNSRPLVLDLGQRIDRDAQAETALPRATIKKKSSLTLVSDQPSEKRNPKVTVKRTPKKELPSFDDFAKIMGASTLIELLEASAAYMSLVLGQDNYSEEQISANLPEHIRNIVKQEECTGMLQRLNKRGFMETADDGNYTISMVRKAAYQKKYLAG